MKQEQYTLISFEIVANLFARIRLLPVDGKYKVTISDAGSKSDKQHNLYWKWNTDVSESGVGGKHEETKKGVHLKAKYLWLVPILVRDDDKFADLYYAWKEKYGHIEERMLWFIEKHASTKHLTVNQMWEYMNEYSNFYSQHVNLTDPKLYGLEER